MNKIKFFVDFYYENSNDEKIHYERSVYLNSDIDKYNSWLDDNQNALDELECNYGVLEMDCNNITLNADGSSYITSDTIEVGFSSYEVEPESFDIVWNKLLELLHQSDIHEIQNN